MPPRGGVVALAVALRANVPVGVLALFEPVALKVLPMAGELEAYTIAKAVFDEYIASFESGNDRAVQRMVDFWFGQGAFDRMPEPLTTYLLKETVSNIKDVRATFRESYSTDSFRRLRMPVVTVVGDRSPDITHRIARVIAAHSPFGSVTKLEKANHALTTTHVDAVAQVIANVAHSACFEGINTCNKEKFQPKTLEGYDVLVIANALGAAQQNLLDAGQPAFTEEEWDATR